MKISIRPVLYIENKIEVKETGPYQRYGPDIIYYFVLGYSKQEQSNLLRGFRRGRYIKNDHQCCDYFDP